MISTFICLIDLIAALYAGEELLALGGTANLIPSPVDHQ